MGLCFWALLELSQAWVECCKDWLPSYLQATLLHTFYIYLSIIGWMLSEREQWEVQSKAFPAHSIQQDESFFFLYAFSERRKNTYREAKGTDVLLLYIFTKIYQRYLIERVWYE